jgi:uncharacterized lipoprotein YmbA
MKKLAFLMLLVVSVFTLSACGSEQKLTILGLDVLEETVYYGEITIGIDLASSTYTEAQLLEIANAVATQMYLKHAEFIGQTKTTLRVNLYDSAASFEAETITNGYVIYQINESPTQPGIGSKTVELIVIS